MQTYSKLNIAFDRLFMSSVAGLMLASLVACGEDGSGDKSTDGHDHDHDQEDAGADPAGDAGVDAGGGEEDALYVVHSATQNADGTRVNYFTLTPSLTAEAELDYKESIEVSGRARLYAQPDLGFFAIGDGENVSITRYTIDDDGKIIPGDSLSLQQLGVTSLGARAVHFVSATKAYYKDTNQGQIIVWNPSEMAIERTIDLPADAVKEGYVTNLSDWAARDGEAYIAVSWTNQTYDRVLPGTKLVRIDTETDDMTVTDDDRCRGLNKVANHEGALYFFSDVINGFGHAVYPDDGGQQDCALRILAGETRFDPAYVGSVAAALGAERAGTVVDVTSDGTAWVQVVDLNVAPTEPGSTYNEWYADGWSWYQVPLETLTDAKAVPGESGAYSGFTATEGASFLIAQTEADYSKTTLVDLSGSELKAGISFAGFPLGAARVR